MKFFEFVETYRDEIIEFFKSIVEFLKTLFGTLGDAKDENA